MRTTLGAAVAASITALALAAGSSTAAAPASATPVGALPAGPTTTVVTKRGAYVAVSLPRQPAKTGLVWRLARRVDAKVLRQVSEADVGPAVVVFGATGKGRAKVVFAATKGDASPKAVRATTYRVTVA